jgi:hypothetical protein
MKYIYCTIAIGEEYLNSALNFVKNLNLISKTHKVLIITDIEMENTENCIFIKIDENETLIINNYFNYNLKHIPIRESSKLDYDYIIFFDSDWEIYTEYSEEKMFNFLNYFKNSEFDFLFERPHLIGTSKLELHNCFWTHKIEPYKLMETEKYDNGHVCNEQFLVFKNNDKLKIFCEKWEELNKFSVDNNVWAFAEGVEIGMSSIEAGMKFSWIGLYILESCFRFKSKDGREFIRF